MKEFINSLQLFAAIPRYNSKLVLILTTIFALMIAIGIIVWFSFKKISKKVLPYQELRNRLTSFFITTGVIGLFLSFFAWQVIPYLSCRILILILIIIATIWLISILIYIKRRFFLELKQFKQNECYKKYLPRSISTNPLQIRRRETEKAKLRG